MTESRSNGFLPITPTFAQNYNLDICIPTIQIEITFHDNIFVIAVFADPSTSFKMSPQCQTTLLEYYKIQQTNVKQTFSRTTEAAGAKSKGSVVRIAKTKKKKNNDNKTSNFEEHLICTHGPFEYLSDFLRVSDLVALSQTNKRLHESVSLRLRHWKCDHSCCIETRNPVFQIQGIPFQCDDCGERHCSDCKNVCKTCNEPLCYDCNEDDVRYCDMCENLYHDQCTYSQLAYSSSS